MSSHVPPRAPGALGIIAGGGSMPIAVARAARASGRTVFIVGIRGISDAGVRDFPHVFIEITQVGRLFSSLRHNGCVEIVLIGAITRPDIGSLRFDFGALTRLPDILSLAMGGDDALLTRIAHIFEREGFAVIGAHEVAPALLAGAGAICGAVPDAAARRDMACGAAILRAISAFDMGQAAIAIDERVVAVEGVEGTDGLLERCAAMRASGRLALKKRRGVLVKGSKRGQDLRFDLPAIGSRTVELAASAGLTGIAVEAGRVLMADEEEMNALARQHGVFVYGFRSGDMAERAP